MLKITLLYGSCRIVVVGGCANGQLLRHDRFDSSLWFWTIIGILGSFVFSLFNYDASYLTLIIIFKVERLGIDDNDLNSEKLDTYIEFLRITRSAELFLMKCNLTGSVLDLLATKCSAKSIKVLKSYF